MSLDARNYAVTEQWGKDCDTVVPPVPVSGRSYRNVALTASDAAAGQAYDAIYESSRHNQKDFEISGIVRQCGKLGWPVWSPLEDYVEGSFQIGTDAVAYRCKAAHGPNTESSAAPGTFIGPVDPVKSASRDLYWESLSDYIGRVLNNSGGGAASFAGGLVYPTAFHSFYESSPPEGWMARNGALVAQASKTVPELYAALSTSANLGKLKTESQWQTMSAADPWNGVGGVPFFVLDKNANTIRLPDTRGMYAEEAGFNGLAVGGVHTDAIRNFTGTVQFNRSPVGNNATGVFAARRVNALSVWDGFDGSVFNNYLDFDPSTVVPTAAANQPRAFGVLGCVYVGTV